jgi:hypothetical protein
MGLQSLRSFDTTTHKPRSTQVAAEAPMSERPSRGELPKHWHSAARQSRDQNSCLNPSQMTNGARGSGVATARYSLPVAARRWAIGDNLGPQERQGRGAPRDSRRGRSSVTRWWAALSRAGIRSRRMSRGGNLAATAPVDSRRLPRRWFLSPLDTQLAVRGRGSTPSATGRGHTHVRGVSQSVDRFVRVLLA